MQTSEQPKTSRYLAAGSPLRCFLYSCQKPFLGTCVHGHDDHFYCSRDCANEGQNASLKNIERLRPRKKA
jgi:hypothetical protein